MSELPDIDQFRKEARVWLEQNAEPLPEINEAEEEDQEVVWGEGSDNVAIFHNFTDEEELARLNAVKAWQAKKFDAGYAMINWPEELGGRGLSASYVRAYMAEERKFVVPSAGELPPTSMGLIAPTVAAFGTPEQKDRWCKAIMRMDICGCQLFSEPSAGSDLASLTTRAVRDGDEWVLNGQKVWTSGARFSEWGLAITRSDFDVPKHKGLTAFMVPFDCKGVEVRPIKQMSGGANFNEVFFTDARIPDEYRLGPVGEGWRVALTCLGFERDHSSSSSSSHTGGSFKQVVAAAAWAGVLEDPIIRQEIAALYSMLRTAQYTNRRVAAGMRAGQTPGPEGSLGKLMWTAGMTKTGEVIARVLGAKVVVDGGEWGTYAWSEHILGAPGYRIAGGSDEIQRNIIGERVLGLPAEPRVDKDLPFSEAQRQTRKA